MKSAMPFSVRHSDKTEELFDGSDRTRVQSRPGNLPMPDFEGRSAFFDQALGANNDTTMRGGTRARATPYVKQVVCESTGSYESPDSKLSNKFLIQNGTPSPLMSEQNQHHSSPQHQEG